MNTLYYGDNLDILRKKLRDETVDLCYIDPPFNSKRNYFQIYNHVEKEDRAQAQAFLDTWTWNELAMAGFQEISTNQEGRYTRQTIELLLGLKNVLGENGLLTYLISMTQRVNEIQRILKATGSFYLHCDPTASHYLKLVLDTIFCPRGGDFRNEIVWCYRGAGYPKKDFGHRHDILFRYSKGSEFTFNLDEVREEYAETTKERFSHHIGNVRGKHNFGVQKLNPLGKQPDDWWQIQPIAPSAKERLGYPTQKPESLLDKVIKASSNEGDTVLDAYCGCGTTVAVSQRLKRNWIGIDITYQSIAVILKRLEDSFGTEIANSVVLNGIPRDMESARALANKKDDRVRKEFEKWAVLTYSKNRATIHEKKGADGGLDGIAYLVTGTDSRDRVIFQVKSGGVKSPDIRDLHGVMHREGAVMGIFITLEEPTKPMQKEAMSAGIYHHELLNRDYPKIQIVTIREMVEENKRADLPLGVEVLKVAQTANVGKQLSFE
ncbi:site-specific DNA-methyltransferase (adenine-specific) [Gammaproteobacteria bacterium]